MAVDRDAIFLALRERLVAIDEFQTVDDRVRPYSEVPPDQQPALFVVKGTETPDQSHGRPPRWHLAATVYLYAHAQSRATLNPQRHMNRLLSRLEAAMERQPGEAGASLAGGLAWATNLGGKCLSCWFSGPVQTDEGALGDQAVAVVTLEILATS